MTNTFFAILTMLDEKVFGPSDDAMRETMWALGGSFIMVLVVIGLIETIEYLG